MEKLLITLAASLLFRLFSEPSFIEEKHDKPLEVKRIIHILEPLSVQQRLPDYVRSVPKGHFVGVSSPSRSIRKARMSSINNAMEQIIRAMGATYSLTYHDRTYGKVDTINREIEDDLRIVAKWFVKAVEQSIVRSDCVTAPNGFHTFFTLIYFPDERIKEMRKLTRGPKVMARIVSINGNTATIEMAETNGVGVTVYEYEICFLRSYKRAEFVSYYIWKVNKSKQLSYTKTLRSPVRLYESSQHIAIPLPAHSMSIGEYLLGTSQSLTIRLQGIDEIGREVVKTIAVN